MLFYILPTSTPFGGDGLQFLTTVTMSYNFVLTGAWCDRFLADQETENIKKPPRK